MFSSILPLCFSITEPLTSFCNVYFSRHVFSPQIIWQFFANTPPHLTAQSNVLNWKVVTQCNMRPKDLVSHALAPCDETCRIFNNQGIIEKMRSNLESFFFQRNRKPINPATPFQTHSKTVTISTFKKTRKKSISVRLIAKQSTQVMTMWQYSPYNRISKQNLIARYKNLPEILIKVDKSIPSSHFF